MPLSMEELLGQKKIIKTIQLSGQINQSHSGKNTLIYLYDDGSIEKKIEAGLYFEFIPMDHSSIAMVSAIIRNTATVKLLPLDQRPNYIVTVLHTINVGLLLLCQLINST